MDLVVARYKEDIGWLSQVPLQVRIILYNKGSELLPVRENMTIVQLENVGREGETYAQHIIRHYESLADYTVFSQANPFDHSPDLLRLLDQLFTGRYMSLSRELLRTSINGCPFQKDISMRDTYEKIFGPEPPASETFHFSPGAIFAVSKEAVRSHDIGFYQNVQSILGTSVCPIEGYVVERLWYLIFDPEHAIDPLFDIPVSTTPEKVNPSASSIVPTPSISSGPVGGGLWIGEIVAIVIAAVALVFYIVSGWRYMRPHSEIPRTTVQISRM